MKQLEKILMTLVAVHFLVIGLNAQENEGIELFDVDFKQIGQKIKVTYKISGAKYYHDIENVELYVSFDGGQTLQGPLKGATGDVGTIKGNGQFSITWDPYKDVAYLSGNPSFHIKMDVTEAEREKHFFLAYNGRVSPTNIASSNPIGISLGVLGKTGWYVSGRLNPDFSLQGNYVYENESVKDYNKPDQYYVFSDESKFPRMSFTAGLTFQLGWKAHWYVGGGFGHRKVLYKIDEYDYGTESLIGDDYVENADYSVAGFETETGLLINTGKLLLNVGMSTLNFSYSGLVLGIGVAF